MREAAETAAIHSGEEGFTLVEALVALMLSVLVLSFLSAGLHFSLKAWRTSDNFDRLSQVEAARGFLRRMLASAEPVRVRGKDGELRLAFTGDSRRLEFVTTLPERHVKAGLYGVTLYLEPEDVGSQAGQTFTLKIRIAPFHAGQSASQVHETSLLTGIQIFEISYFGDLTEDLKPDWHPEWEQNSGLPSLIRLDIRFLEEIHQMPQTLILQVNMS